MPIPRHVLMATIAPIPTMWPATLHPSKSVNLKPINFKFGNVIKFDEPHLPWKFEKNLPSGTWVINEESSSHSFLWEFWLPFSDDVNSSVSEATLTPWQENSLFPQCKNCQCRGSNHCWNIRFAFHQISRHLAISTMVWSLPGGPTV